MAFLRPVWKMKEHPWRGKSLLVKHARTNKGESFYMAENMCLMVTEGSEYINSFTRAVELAAAAVDLHKQTVLYLDKDWNRYAQVEFFSAFEKRKQTRESAVKLRSFLNAGGQLWVSPSNLSQEPLIEGASVVDDKTLLTFLNQDTIVLTY